MRRTLHRIASWPIGWNEAKEDVAVRVTPSRRSPQFSERSALLRGSKVGLVKKAGTLRCGERVWNWRVSLHLGFEYLAWLHRLPALHGGRRWDGSKPWHE